MEGQQQIRRDLITVAVVGVLLVGALLLISSGPAFAQSAAEDQYAVEDQYSSASASASVSPDDVEDSSTIFEDPTYDT
jgi:hypothetical protein